MVTSLPPNTAPLVVSIGNSVRRSSSTPYSEKAVCPTRYPAASMLTASTTSPTSTNYIASPGLYGRLLGALAGLATPVLVALSGATQTALKERKGLLTELQNEVVARCGVAAEVGDAEEDVLGSPL